MFVGGCFGREFDSLQLHCLSGRVAQLVRASARHAEGRRFDTCRDHRPERSLAWQSACFGSRRPQVQILPFRQGTDVAQLAEWRSHKARDAGSRPAVGTKTQARVNGPCTVAVLVCVRQPRSACLSGRKRQPAKLEPSQVRYLSGGLKQIWKRGRAD